MEIYYVKLPNCFGDCTNFEARIKDTMWVENSSSFLAAVRYKDETQYFTYEGVIKLYDSQIDETYPCTIVKKGNNCELQIVYVVKEIK